MNYFISFIYGTSLFYIHRFFPFSSVFISLILISLISFTKFRKRIGKTLFHVFIIAIIAASGFYYAKLRYVEPPSLSHIAGETIELRGVANSEPVSLDSKSYQGVTAFSQRIEIREPENLKELRLISNRVLFSDRIYHIKAHIPNDAYSLNPGINHNLLSGYAVEIKEAGTNPNGFFKRLRIRLNDFMKRNFSSESSPFLMSIITGERSLLTKETRDAFNATGLAHILSISGAHFGLLLFVLFGLFRFLVKALPYNMLVRLTVYLSPSQIAAILCIPFMIGYLGISDMSIPSIRSFIMITLFLSGLLIHRKGFWLNTLLFAAVVIILIQPDSILDLSFQLSFIAVLCIGLVTDQKSGRAEERKLDNTKQIKRFERFKLLSVALLHYCTTALKISLAATIGTAPLVAYYFHYFSLVSPITNLIITPVIGFVVLPLSLVSSFVFLASGVFPLSSFIDAITIFVLDAVKYTAQWNFVDIKIPAFPSILLVLFYLGILVYVITGNGRRAIGNSKNSSENPIAYSLWPIPLLITISVVPIIIYACIKIFEHEGIQITYLDVGQGDSAVVELPDKRTLVIDTGRKGFQTGEFLKYRGIKNIDAVVLSHGQSDHAGGIFHLLRNFNVHEIWDNGRLIYPQGFMEQRKLQRGDVIKGSGYIITVLHPYDGFYTMHSGDSDENNDSVVLRIQGYKNTFLFAGDIEEEAEEDLSHLGEHLKSNVLKVPHHGSRTSSSQVFVPAVSPDIAVISVGRKNSYSHPHDEVLNMFSNAKIYRTDIDGAIGIRELLNGRLEIKTWKEFRMTEAKSISDELMNFKKLFRVW
ncbi:MAG: DNA internalization-related competence protein ComEC/Rec2 [Thermodesulfovibrionales bacterium]|jgi:competence protein ComEC|nr:DNA internalization-related competence protein ComEC/Rec2 [Thermodesulfovibrionales bacterium]